MERIRRPGISGGQEGFSLIEALVASVVTGILTVSVFYFLTSQNGLGLRSGDMLRSLNLGKLKMDSLKVADYDALEAGSDTVSERYIRAWNVAPDTEGRKKIELAVYWPLSADHNVVFTTLMGDPRFKE